MAQVDFSPVGIALKQHELYGYDDARLYEEAVKIKTDIISWALENFILKDRQIDWLNQQDDTFKYEFSEIISKGFVGRFDFNILFNGPAESWKSKRVSARQDSGIKVIDIFVEYSP